MKKLFTIMLVCTCTAGFAQTDTLTRKKLDELTRAVTLITKRVDEISKLPATPPADAAKPGVMVPAVAAVAAQPLCQNKHLSFSQKMFVTSPLWVSVLFMIYFIYRLKKEGFKLSDALSGEGVTIQKANPFYDPANTALAPATIDVTDFPRSSSRLVAFLAVWRLL